MGALMVVGVLAVLAAPREERHAIRPIQTEGLQPAPAREALEWIVRLALLLTGALILGSGLAANAGILARVLGAVGATRRRQGGPGGLGVGRSGLGASRRGHRRLRRDRPRRDAAARGAHAAGRLPAVGAGRSAE